MTSLPRVLALALFVALAALVALLTVPMWTDVRATLPADRTAAGVVHPALPPAHARLRVFSQRAALTLAVIGAATALALVVSLAARSHRGAESRSPFALARQEIDTLTHLAKSSAAQHEALSRERDVRVRAEQDSALKQQLLTQSLEEKIRIGRDLHDGIIQSLYAVGLTLESVRALVKSDPAEADRRLEQTRARLNDTIRDVRAYIIGLAPDHLRRAGFAHALDATLAELRAGREVRFDIKIDDAAAALLSPEQGVEALQIVREAVSNALRHGGASLVSIRVHQGDREVCLLVQDNGTGFQPAATREEGHGLRNMRARAERLGATLRVTSQSGEGTRVLATLPLLQTANP